MSLSYYSKPKLCFDSSPIEPQNLSFFVLSVPHKCIIAFSKKCKSCLLWALLVFHSVISYAHELKPASFSPINLSCVNFIISLATKKGRGGYFSLPNRFMIWKKKLTGIYTLHY